MNLSLIITALGTGLLVVVGAAVAIVYLRWDARVSKEIKAFPARFERATPATAKITEVGGAYSSRNGGRTSVAFRMEVQPPFGAAYPAISVWDVKPTHAHGLEGKTIAIKIDKENPQIIFSGETWAKQPLLRAYDEDDLAN